MDKWMDGWMDGLIDKRMGRRIYNWIDRCTVKIDGRENKQTDKKKDK